MTAEPTPVARIRWNIFARELELILARRNLRLGHLDDRKDEQGPLVHPEKVGGYSARSTRPRTSPRSTPTRCAA